MCKRLKPLFEITKPLETSETFKALLILKLSKKAKICEFEVITFAIKSISL